MPPRKKPNSSSSSSSSKKSNPTNQPQPSKFGIQHFFQRHTQNGENVLLASRNPKPSSPSNAAVSTSHNPATDAPSSAPEKSGLPVRNPINYPENAPDLQKPDATHAVSASRDPKSRSGSQANDPNSASQNMPTDNIVVMDVSSDEEDLSEGSQVNDPNSGSLNTPTDNIAVMDVSSDESLSEGSQANDPNSGSQNTPTDNIAVMDVSSDESLSEVPPEVSKSVPLKRFKFSPVTITMSYREKSRAQRTPCEYRLPTAQGLGSCDLEHTKEGQTPVRLGAYGHTSLTQLGYEYQPASYDTDASFHLSHMPSTMREVGVCSPSHVARLFPHSSSGADDSETQPLDNSQTQAPEDLHGGAGDTHDVQPEDLATQVLRPDQIRTISINLDGSTCFEVLTIADLHKNWGIPTGKRVVLEYNAASQPVGLSANKFRRQTGKLIRSGAYVHIRDAWVHVKNSTKEDIWNALMVGFYIPPTYDLAAVKRDAFQDMGEKLKSWRHKLKKQLNIQSDDTPEMVRARVGEANLSKYDPEDLEALLDKWCDRANQEYAAHMKALRALNNTPHCAGSKSFARLTHEETITNGTPPTRAQTYIKSHKKKDGSYPNDIIKERCERMTELIPTDPATLSSVTQGTVRWAPNDAYAQAHDNKPEYAGRVRQIGPNVLPVRGTIHSYYIPSQARSQSSRHSTISQEVLDRALEAERARHRAEIGAVLASQAQMVTRYEARFYQLEEMMRQSISVPGVTQHTTTPNRAFIPCLNVRSSIGSG